MSNDNNNGNNDCTATTAFGPLRSEMDVLALESMVKRKVALDAANNAALALGKTMVSLAAECNLKPVRMGAILSGQAPLEAPTQALLEAALELSSGTLNTLQPPPVRTGDGAIYRLHEAIDVYAPALQRWMNEEYGDFILSAIDFTIDLEDYTTAAGVRRMKITLDGKALKYSNDDAWRP